MFRSGRGKNEQIFCSNAFPMNFKSTSSVGNSRINSSQRVRQISKSQSQILINNLSIVTNSPDVKLLLGQVEETSSRLNAFCEKYQVYLDTPSLVSNAEAIGQIQTTVGKARLLISQKLVQFRNLCINNLNGAKELDEFKTRANDLAGFWDMVLIQVYEVYSMFENLEHLRNNQWRGAEKRRVELTKSKMERDELDELNARIKAREEATKRRLTEAKARKNLKLPNFNR
jgi:hypothetical protein